MRGERLLTTVIVLALAAVGCGPSGALPATVPSSVVSTATPDTTTPPQATTTSSTTVAVPSSVPTTTDRRAEIQAIFEDLERRRLDALYRGDREAFAALFVNERYLEVSLGAFDVVSFTSPPDVAVDVGEVVTDVPGCLAAWVVDTLDGQRARPILYVLQPLEAGGWGYAFGGEGWLCDGPHPLES